MQYRQLGGTNLQLSAISLGSWLTYGTNVDDSVARQCIDAAFDAGVNFFDTANMYGQGQAETFLGEALRGKRRDDYLVATKLFFPMGDSGRGLSAEQVRIQAEASLRRLGTGHIDLYQCHRFDPNIPLEETMGALTDLVREGLVRYIGVSEWTPEQIQAASEVPSVVRLASNQPEYSLLKRDVETTVVPVSESLNMGQIVFGSLAQGLLTGKYEPRQNPPEGSRVAAGGLPAAMIAPWMRNPALLGAVQDLRPIADGEGITMAQMALAWVLGRKHSGKPWVTSAITGASSPEQVRENVKAAEITLAPETVAAIDETVAPYLVTKSLDTRLSEPAPKLP